MRRTTNLSLCGASSSAPLLSFRRTTTTLHGPLFSLSVTHHRNPNNNNIQSFHSTRKNRLDENDDSLSAADRALLQEVKAAKEKKKRLRNISKKERLRQKIEGMDFRPPPPDFLRSTEASPQQASTLSSLPRLPSSYAQPQGEEGQQEQEGRQEETVSAEGLGPNAIAQLKMRRKVFFDPTLDPRVKEKGYNPLVDDWVDVNNPPFMGLKRTYYRPGPFFIGTCVSTKNAKTAVVESPYWMREKKFGKYIAARRVTVFQAHDEDQVCEVGDIVEVRHSRAHSKTKRFEVTRIVRKDLGNAFLKEHPEYAVTRTRLGMRKRIEAFREAQIKGLSMEEFEEQQLAEARSKRAEREREREGEQGEFAA
ncbi:hypothetical protein QOT17_012908 [Balamuthia mandrillaris]